MSLAEIEREALALSENERARLIASLIETLPTDVDVSDEEALARDAEIEAGRADEISREEFNRRVREERGR
jgi:hypothetical protein